MTGADGAAAAALRRSNPLAGVLPGSWSDPFIVGGAAEVPQFYVESFHIPPFLLSIYQAAGAAYGIPWQTLAAINEVETDYGTNLDVSSAGAIGWMQFLPSTWKRYGVDASGRRRRSLQRRRRDLRRRALSRGGGRPAQPARRDLRLQPLARLRAVGAPAGAAAQRRAERAGQLRHRARRGRLPDTAALSRPLSQGPIGAVSAPPSVRPPGSARAGRPARRHRPAPLAPRAARPRRAAGPGSRDPRLLERRGGRRSGRHDRRDRPQPQARAVRDRAQRLRRPLHLRQPCIGIGVVPEAQAPPAERADPLDGRTRRARLRPAPDKRARERRRAVARERRSRGCLQPPAGRGAAVPLPPAVATLNLTSRPSAATLFTPFPCSSARAASPSPRVRACARAFSRATSPEPSGCARASSNWRR